LLVRFAGGAFAFDIGPLGRSRAAAALVMVPNETSGGQSTMGGVNRPNILKR
jgi:hypothetical protein